MTASTSNPLEKENNPLRSRPLPRFLHSSARPALGLLCLSALLLPAAHAQTAPVQKPAPAAAPAIPKEAAKEPPAPTVGPIVPSPALPSATPPDATLPGTPVARLVAPPPTRTLSLDECLQAAYTNADTTLRYGLSEDQARQGIAAAKAAFRPTVTATGRVTASSGSGLTSQSSDGVLVQRERARAGLSAALPLYDAGLRKDLLKIAQSGLRQTQDSILVDRGLLRQTTLVSFFRLLRAQRLAESAGLLVEGGRQSLSAAQTRLSVGAVTRGDVLVAQSQLASALATQDGRELELIAARAQLARVLGEDPTQTVLTVSSPPNDAAPIDTADTLIARALQSSPDRDRLVAQRDAAALALQAVRADQSPRITARASAGISASGNNNSGGSSNNNVYSQVALNATLPLFNKAALHAREQSQQDAIQLRDLAIRQFDRLVKERILVASASYASADAQVAARQSAVSDAEQAATLAQERYAVGRGTQAEVFAAQQRLADTRDQLAVTLSQRDLLGMGLRLGIGIQQPLPTGLDNGFDPLTAPLPDAGAAGGSLTSPDALPGGLGGTGVGTGGITTPGTNGSSSGGYLNQGF